MPNSNELPDPPWRVYGYVNDNRGGTSPKTWFYWDGCAVFQHKNLEWVQWSVFPMNIVVVPHPRNDDEAIKIIEESKGAK